MKRLFYIILLFTLNVVVLTPKADAQTSDRDNIRLGNKQFRNGIKHKDAGALTKALTFFTKANGIKKTVESLYNFGCASYLTQQKDSAAEKAFLDADSIGFKNQLKRAKNFHNLGNLWYMRGVQQLRSNGQNGQQCFMKAVDYYKSSLRCNPKDDETRYNLAMAQHQLKKSGNNGGGNDNKNNKDNKGKDKNKDKDKQNKDQQNKDQQDKQNQQNKDKQKQNQQNQQDQEKKGQMSNQTAEQLLNSAQQDEKNVQQKVKVNPGSRRSLEKDW